MVSAVPAEVPHWCYGQLDSLSQSMGLRIRSMIQRWRFTTAMGHCCRLTTIGQMTRATRVKLWPADSLQKVPLNQRSLPYYRRAITLRSCEDGTELKVSPCSMRINCLSPIFAREQWYNGVQLVLVVMSSEVETSLTTFPSIPHGDRAPWLHCSRLALSRCS